MSIESKNHRQPSAQARVSEGTRAMARPATLKFADLDQERAFWITQKTDVQKEFEDAKQGLIQDLSEASRKLRGEEFMAKKISIEAHWSSSRQGLVMRLREIEAALASVKLRKKQEADRVAYQNGVTSGGLIRADGNVDLGQAMLVLIEEFRGLRKDLSTLLANKEVP